MADVAAIAAAAVVQPESARIEAEIGVEWDPGLSGMGTLAVYPKHTAV